MHLGRRYLHPPPLSSMVGKGGRGAQTADMTGHPNKHDAARHRGINTAPRGKQNPNRGQAYRLATARRPSTMRNANRKDEAGRQGSETP